MPLPGGVRKCEAMAASDEASEAVRDPPGEEADKFGPRNRWLRVVGVIAVVALTTVAVGWWAAPLTLAAGVGPAAIVWLARVKIRGVSGDVLGAVEQVAECLVLVVATGLAAEWALWWS